MRLAEVSLSIFLFLYFRRRVEVHRKKAFVLCTCGNSPKYTWEKEEGLFDYKSEGARLPYGNFRFFEVEAHLSDERICLPGDPLRLRELMYTSGRICGSQIHLEVPRKRVAHLYFISFFPVFYFEFTLSI